MASYDGQGRLAQVVLSEAEVARLRGVPALLVATGFVLLIDVALFRMNVIRFRREEILTNWK